MSRISIVLIVVFTFVACNKNKCTDSGAFNFDSEENCMFTKAIFYAGSNKVGGNGNLIVRIEVFRRILNEDEKIGEIANLQEENSAPSGCAIPEKGIEYKFTETTTDAIFTTRYYFENGIEEAGETYTISTSSTQECIVNNLTL